MLRAGCGDSFGLCLKPHSALKFCWNQHMLFNVIALSCQLFKYSFVLVGPPADK